MNLDTNYSNHVVKATHQISSLCIQELHLHRLTFGSNLQFIPLKVAFVLHARTFLTQEQKSLVRFAMFPNMGRVSISCGGQCVTDVTELHLCIRYRIIKFFNRGFLVGSCQICNPCQTYIYPPEQYVTGLTELHLRIRSTKSNFQKYFLSFQICKAWLHIAKA